jgi:hypothetical protein
MWIIQELCVAREINATMVQHRNLLYKLPDVGAAAVWASNGGYGIIISEPNAGRLVHLYHAKHTYQNRGDLDAELTRKNGIMFLPNTSNAFQASIRVDKVFALIGLANDLRPSSDKLLLRPNCECPVEVVMNDLARVITRQHKNLTPLQYVRSYCREHPSLPTWVPDWTSVRNPRDPCWSQSHQSAVPCFSRWESRAFSLRRRRHASG